MFYIRFYNFDKKVNSLKVPGTSDDFTRYRCNVKTASSIINPVIELQKDSVPVYNYCFIEEFKRYYFITDITFSMGMWIISTACDTLASFREDIMNSRQYVMRSASSRDPDLIDTLYPAKTSAFGKFEHTDYNAHRYNSSTKEWTTVQYFNRQMSAGGFCLGILSGNTTGVTYYMVNASAFQKILTTLFTFKPADMTDFSTSLGNAIWNPIQYLVSVKWYPIMPLSVNTGGTVSAINIGGHDFNTVSDFGFVTPGDVILIMSSYCIERFRINLDIPRHPDSASYPYLNQSPYAEYNLYFQPFGDIPLDSTKIYSQNRIQVCWTIDYPSGAVILEVNSGGDLVFSSSNEIGVSLPISGLVMQWQGAVAVAGINYIKGTEVGSAVYNLSHPLKSLTTLRNPYHPETWPQYDPKAEQNADLLGTVRDVIASTLGQVTTKGSPGSFLSYNLGVPYIYAWFRITASRDDARFGQPLQQNRRIDSLSGFCICSDAYVNYSAGCPTIEEKRRVDAMLNSGIFIE